MFKRFWQISLVLAATLVAVHAQTPPSGAAQSTPPQAPKTHLKVGQAAPDFMLLDTAGKLLKLSDFKGKRNVVLAFYVLAFTGG